MKKVIAAALSLFILLSVCGCGYASVAKTVTNSSEAESTSSICVAMNPVISYAGGEDRAFESIFSCLEADYVSGEYSLYSDSDWHWMYYDESGESWNERRADGVSAWQNCKLENKNEVPYSYAFSENGAASLTPYMTENVNILPYVLDTVPESGVILSVSGKYDEGICYTVPESGTITLSDTENGQISVIRRIQGVATYSLDNDKTDRGAKVIIYHNGDPLWAAEFGNPKHYLSTNEDDGVYAVDFPELSDIRVSAGDVISIVVRNETDIRCASDFIPEKAEEYKEVSLISSDGIANYISAGGSAYLFSGIQLRLDRVRDRYQAYSRELSDEYLEPYFRYSAELGYETVIFPVRWRDIELKKDEYSFEALKIYYEYCAEYDLKVQLLWFGSDVCGFNTNAPKYILDDKATYSRLRDYPEVLNYGDMDLVEREVKAFNELLGFLAEFDTAERTVAIQIENEPNATAYQGPALDDFTDSDKIDRTAWVAGQKEQIAALMNTLGMCVKNGPYRCVTRVNFITYQCYYNGTKNQEVKEICDLEGIDIVGFDSYSVDVSTSLMNVLDFEGNISHYPEFGANHSNMIPQTLLAISERSGLLAYQLKAVDEDAGSIFADLDNVWNMPQGEPQSRPVLDVDGTVINQASADSYRIDAAELKAMNMALSKGSDKIVLNDPEKTNIFNIKRSVNCLESFTVGNVAITFKNTGADDFGGCGYVTAVSDKEYIMFATRGESSFSFSGCGIRSVSCGSYDENGNWESDRELPASSIVSISRAEADSGTLYRIEVN